MSRHARFVFGLLLSALILPGAANPAAAARSSTEPWSGKLNLYSEGVFATQYTWTWCVGASAQAMLNIIKDTTNTTRLRQKRLVRYAMNHDAILDSNRGGSDAIGFARTLNHFGGGNYTPTFSNTYRSAIRKAVRRIAITSKPVGLLVMGGRHAWVLTGFKATANPATTDNFEVTDLYVLGSLYPKQHRGYFDMPPNSRLTAEELRTPFRRFDDPDSPAFLGYWVTVSP